MSNVVASEQQLKKTMLQTLSATIGGLISGWSYMYTNSLLTPIMSHMINNIIYCKNFHYNYNQYCQEWMTVIEDEDEQVTRNN